MRKLKLFLIGIVIATIGIAQGQSPDKENAETRKFWNDQDAKAIRALLTEAFETDWNNHQPALVATPDKCAPGAIFINVTGGWLIGCEKWAELITRLHGPGGPFHDHTRRHAVEELRFIRPEGIRPTLAVPAIAHRASCRRFGQQINCPAARH